MSKAKLKKALADLDKEEIIEMVGELYDARKDAKEYLEYWLNPDSGKELERRKLLLRKMFFSSSDKPKGLPSATSVKNIVKDYSSMCFDVENTADLMVWIAECYVDWFAKKRKVAALPTIDKALHNAREYVENAELEQVFGIRLERITSLLEEKKNDAKIRSGRKGWRWYF